MREKRVDNVYRLMPNQIIPAFSRRAFLKAGVLGAAPFVIGDTFALEGGHDLRLALMSDVHIPVDRLPGACLPRLRMGRHPGGFLLFGDLRSQPHVRRNTAAQMEHMVLYRRYVRQSVNALSVSVMSQIFSPSMVTIASVSAGSSAVVSKSKRAKEFFSL